MALAPGAAGGAFLRGLRRGGGVSPDPDGAIAPKRCATPNERQSRFALDLDRNPTPEIERSFPSFREIPHFVRRVEASLCASVAMDVFCRCAGCPGCSGVTNPLGGLCDKDPQRYTVKRKTANGVGVGTGFRKYCKPCLRVQEQLRNAAKKEGEIRGLGSLYGNSHSQINHGTAFGHDHVPGNRPRIVIFGDSITEQSFCEGGFGAAFADRYKRHADVVLRGYSGYNSRDAVALLPHIFPVNDLTPPVLVTVCFGANDSVTENSTMATVQGVPLEEYKGNLVKILTHLSNLEPPPAVLVMSPPPVDSNEWKKTCDDNNYHTDALPDRNLNRTGQYAHAAINVARTFADNTGEYLSVYGLNLFDKLQGVEMWKSFLSDGLHLSKEGYKFVSELMLQSVEEKFDLEADDNPSDFPSFLDVDWKTPGRTIDQFVEKKMNAQRGDEFDI